MNTSSEIHSICNDKESEMKRNLIVLYLILAWFIAIPVYALDDGVENLRQTGKAFASVAQEVSPSVVFIQVESKASASNIAQFTWPFGNESPFGDDLFKHFFDDQFPGSPKGPQPKMPQGKRRAIGQGSGFVFSAKDGLLSGKSYILTNNHVVENADKILVKLQDEREFEAKITGRDPKSDVAVLEINTGGLPALSFADSSQLEVGEWVVAIGNPFGLSHTLTVGVVSAKGRTSVGINVYEDFIQTDAAINPGNSGGPLVDLDGKVVGINTALFSRSGGYMGIGFAIPSNLAKEIANQLIKNGEVTRGYMGIMIQQITPDLAKSFNVKPGQGIIVSQVSEGSPAKKAGLAPGDVIISFRGKPVKEVGRFRNLVALIPPGSREQLVILRGGKREKLNITIGKLAEENKLASAEPSQSTEKIGLSVQTLTPQLAKQFDAKPGEGVVVTTVQPGSIAAMGGIKTGMVILQVNHKPVKSAAEFKRAVKKSSNEKRVLLLARKGNVQQFFALSW